jgi:capsular polysaccharide transport system permease protein
MLQFLRQFDLQRRVIGALLIREIYTRFGREGIGFAWIIAEPLMFALPVLALWSIARAKYEHGILLMPVMITGYLGILLFRHIGSTMLMFVRSNATLLYHRQVTILDIFFARALLEIVSNLTALVVTIGVFVEFGEMSFPVDLPLFYLGYFFMIWWCLAVGLIVGAFCERSKLVEKIWPVYSYTYLFYSGFFYIADWLPPSLRKIALYQPCLQAYEMIRGGVFGPAVRTYGDPAYTAAALSVLTLIGLWAIRDARKYIVLI